MKINNKILWIILGGLILVIFAIAALNFKLLNIEPSNTKSSNSETSDASNIKPSDIKPLNSETFSHTDPNFSLQYPKNISITKFEDGASETILLKDPQQKDTQIFISSFDEDIVLSAERIKKDLPKLVIENPTEVMIGGKVKAVSFTSTNNLAIPTREVWFVYNGYLYQISIPLEIESAIGEILKTWKFN